MKVIALGNHALLGILYHFSFASSICRYVDEAHTMLMSDEHELKVRASKWISDESGVTNSDTYPRERAADICLS